jgi:putative membrane protein
MSAQFQAPEIQSFASGMPLALAHTALTLTALLLASALYCVLSPHKEIRLIQQGNTAAGVSLGGTILGLAIPLSASLAVSTSALEIALWALAIMSLQLLVFRLTDVLLKGLPERIQDGEVGAALLSAGARIAAALVLAAGVTG